MQDCSRNQGGTGLGLTVAKSLAKKMGAELNAHVLSNKLLDSGIYASEISFELCMKPIDR